MHISSSGIIKADEGYKTKEEEGLESAKSEEEGTIHGYAEEEEEEEEEEGVESAEDEEEGNIH
jgi:hypothetical protein